MEKPLATPSQRFGPSGSSGWRENLAEAMRFWEPWRVVYNVVLAAVAAVWLVATWPHFRPALTLPSLVILSVLALLANVCYCGAYLVDIPMQRWVLGAGWVNRRWGLWLLGTILAIVMENYWIADEIYPFVN